MMYSRTLLTAAGLAIVAVLSGCSTSTNTNSFAQAKAYMDAGAGALDAAAQQYLAAMPAPSATNAALVRDLITQLHTVRTALDATTLPADWQSGALQAVAVMQQLTPVVTPFLGAAAPYLPLAIAAVQAFIANLPPPATIPPVPPAALLHKAAEARR